MELLKAPIGSIWGTSDVPVSSSKWVWRQLGNIEVSLFLMCGSATHPVLFDETDIIIQGKMRQQPAAA